MADESPQLVQAPAKRDKKPRAQPIADPPADSPGVGIIEADRKWASSQVELAMALGVARKTISRWMKEEGRPTTRSDGRMSIQEWRDWADRHGKAVDSEVGTSENSLKAQQVALQNEKLEYQISVIKKTFVPVADVERWSGEMGAEIRKIVVRLHLLAQTMTGLEYSELLKILLDQEDQILSQLHLIGARLEEWRNKVEK